MKYRYTYLKGSANNSEAVSIDIYRPNGDYETTALVTLNIFLAGIKVFPCGNGDDIKLTAEQRLAVLHVAREGREAIISGTIKTRSGWHESGVGSFGDYVQPGDEVDEEFVEYFVNALPPTTYRGDLVQGGEPHSDAQDTAGRWRPTYPTFSKIDGVWHFTGYCFEGGRENRVERESDIERLMCVVGEELKGGAAS